MKLRLLVLVWVSLAAIVLGAGCSAKPALKENPFWPPPPEKKRIQFIRSITGKKDLKQSRFDRFKQTLAGPENLERIVKPYGVCVDNRGRIFVADAGNQCVLVMNENPRKGEEALSYIGRSGNGLLQEPAGVATDPQGNIYVSDVKQAVVYGYSPDLEFKQAYGGAGKLSRPAGLSYNRVTHELVVLDAKAHDIKFFDEAGNLIRTVGGPGVEPGKFNIPTNVVCAPDGTIYVVDSMNFRVQTLKPTGEYISAFGQANNVPGSFARPKGLALDSDGHLWVVDAAFDNIQVFQSDGTLLLFFGGAGTEPGQFQLPAGLCFDTNNFLYVSDQYNRRIQVFQYFPEKVSLSP